MIYEREKCLNVQINCENVVIYGSNMKCNSKSLIFGENININTFCFTFSQWRKLVCCGRLNLKEKNAQSAILIDKREVKSSIYIKYIWIVEKLFSYAKKVIAVFWSRKTTFILKSFNDDTLTVATRHISFKLNQGGSTRPAKILIDRTHYQLKAERYLRRISIQMKF